MQCMTIKKTMMRAAAGAAGQPRAAGAEVQRLRSLPGGHAQTAAPANTLWLRRRRPARETPQR